MTSISLSTFRYDSAAGPGPSRYASAARRTCCASRSASEYTATDAMPSSSSARITRTAISPRLATSTFENIGVAHGIRRDLTRPSRSSWLPKMKCTRMAAAAALTATMAFTASAGAQELDSQITTLTRATPVAAYGNTVAWSERDSATGQYRLMVLRGHRWGPVAVAQRTIP